MTITDPTTDPDISGPLDQFLAAHEQELIAFRRQLHANPELSWEEHQTTALVSSRLEVAGLTPRPLVTDTGLVVDIDGGSPGPTVALRADLDALPLDDEKDVPYRSTKDGVCHACGHDVHTTIVLGAALALAGILPESGLAGRIRLVFQPAEESIPGGAVGLAQTDVLDDVEVIYALHCDPALDVGHVGLRVGPITSAADRVRIHLHGAGGHTARPHLTTDLVHVAARIITDLPAGLTKLTDVRDGATLVFGSVQSGHAPNVIPSSAEILGTLRVRGRATWDEAPDVVERVLASIVAPFGAEYDLDYQRGSPPVDNDARATAVLREATRRALGTNAAVATEHSLGNEDFSWYLERVPGSYARLGVRPVGSERQLDIHASTFDVDEAAIAAGVRVMTHAALAALTEYGARGAGIDSSAFDYDLPTSAIAQVPAEPRDAARLLVDRGIDRPVDHRTVADLPDLLGPGDVLVVNDTRVLPARLRLHKGSGGAIEVLLLVRQGEDTWEALVRPNRRVPEGTILEDDGGPVLEVGTDLGDGRRRVRLLRPEADVLAIGEVPLPPYIHTPLADPERYQTVYGSRAASVAAPTAGLHLTDAVLDQCRARGAQVMTVDLEVGLGTFRPITADRVEDHAMHAERYRVPPWTWEACRAAERVVAVGTTTVRALESAAASAEPVGESKLFIHGDYEFQVVDALLTNFHTPRSSLLVLIDAFVGPRWRNLYAEALSTGYRFLSFGDAMFLTRSR